MNVKRPKNTKNKGFVEFLFFKQRNRYIGVCLTFNIVEEGEDLSKLKKSLLESAELHLKTVIRENLSDDLLNRYAPKQYWDKYFEFQKMVSKKRLENARLTREIPLAFSLPLNELTAAHR